MSLMEKKYNLTLNVMQNNRYVDSQVRNLHVKMFFSYSLWSISNKYPGIIYLNYNYTHNEGKQEYAEFLEEGLGNVFFHQQIPCPEKSLKTVQETMLGTLSEILHCQQRSMRRQLSLLYDHSHTGIYCKQIDLKSLRLPFTTRITEYVSWKRLFRLVHLLLREKINYITVNQWPSCFV